MKEQDGDDGLHEAAQERGPGGAHGVADHEEDERADRGGDDEALGGEVGEERPPGVDDRAA